MFKFFKKKINAFFDWRFERILTAQEQLRLNQEKTEKELNDMQSSMLSQFQKIEVSEENIYSRIEAAEQNLDYYGMINRLLKEHRYFNPELLYLDANASGNKKILLIGFYGADNLGDELMLQTVLSCFPEDRLKDVTVMLCDNEQYDYLHLPAVNLMHLPGDVWDYNILAQKFDALIWGGGALIDDCFYQDKTNALNNALIELSFRFIAFKKKVYALGLSTNKELNNPQFIERLRFVCEKSEFFSVRDIYSQELLGKVGIKNVSYLDDLVFYNKLWKTLPSATAVKKGDEPKRIGVIWVCNPDTEDEFKLLIKRIRDTFNGECIIKLMPFYNYCGTDIAYFNRLTKEVGYEDMVICRYTNILEGLVKEIEDTDYMVNMRYHGMLISGILQKQSFNVCYDTHRHYENKTKHLADVFGMKDSFVDFSKMKDGFELRFASPVDTFSLPESSKLEKILEGVCE